MQSTNRRVNTKLGRSSLMPARGNEDSAIQNNGRMSILPTSAGQRKSRIPDASEIVDYSFKEWKQITDEIFFNPNLMRLYLNNNQLKSFNVNFSLFHNLHLLNLSYNPLLEIPSCLLQLPTLETLNLSGCQLHSNTVNAFDFSLMDATLRTLYLTNNLLDVIPVSVMQLRKLKKLALAYNNISEIPSDIIQMKQLYFLGLSYNQLKKLNPILSKLPRLRGVAFDHNPFQEHAMLEAAKIMSVSTSIIVLEECNIAEIALSKNDFEPPFKKVQEYFYRHPDAQNYFKEEITRKRPSHRRSVSKAESLEMLQSNTTTAAMERLHIGSQSVVDLNALVSEPLCPLCRLVVDTDPGLPPPPPPEMAVLSDASSDTYASNAMRDILSDYGVINSPNITDQDKAKKENVSPSSANSTPGVLIDDQWWHSHCWKEYVQSGQLYSNTIHTNQCAHCGRSVLQQVYLNALDRVWHAACFQCRTCKKQLTDNYYENEGVGPYCEEHIYSARGLVCQQCQGAIKDAYIEEDGLKYHTNHFICSKCENSLTTIRFERKGNDLICTDCQ